MGNYPPLRIETIDDGMIDASQVWQLLLALRAQRRAGQYPLTVRLEAPFSDIHLRVDAQGWYCPGPLDPAARQWLNLYTPLLAAVPTRPFVLAHLGQSLDGRIATDNGVSQTINGPENLDHLHRLRALSDVVLVGASTVAEDNPRLTTRRVPGESPLRVVLDPDCRLDPELGIFCDGAAPTLVFYREGCCPTVAVETEALPTAEGTRLCLETLLQRLLARGHSVIFIEGGGVTVSAFVQAGLVDVLQLTVAPMIIGSGRPSVQLPPLSSLEGALRPRVRCFPQGADTLFHCDLRSPR